MIDIKEIPTQDIPDGLLVKFNRQTDTATEYSTCNINLGQRLYEEPKDVREIIAIYKRIK